MAYTYYQRADGTICRAKGSGRAIVVGALASEFDTDDWDVLARALDKYTDKLNRIEHAAWGVAEGAWNALGSLGTPALFLLDQFGGVKNGQTRKAWASLLDRLQLVRATIDAQKELEQQWLDQRTARLEAAQLAADAERSDAPKRRKKKRSKRSTDKLEPPM